MNEEQRFEQHADTPHLQLLFHGAQSTLNSAVRSKTMRSVQGREHQLLMRVGLAMGLMEANTSNVI
jgi:hypothetical protein